MLIFRAKIALNAVRNLHDLIFIVLDNGVTDYSETSDFIVRFYSFMFKAEIKGVFNRS